MHFGMESLIKFFIYLSIYLYKTPRERGFWLLNNLVKVVEYIPSMYQDKKNLSERDICSKYITPSLHRSGWNKPFHIREEKSFTAGRIMVEGIKTKRLKPKRADYILYLRPNLPIAVLEAKDNNHGVSDGMQQALEYADTLDIPFVYSSNGDSFVEHDRTKSTGTVEREIGLDAFPTPEELLQRYRESKQINETELKIIEQDYYEDQDSKEPRYYQQIAINRVLESVAKGNNRQLLVMATGTGKTFVAFQIIWRLWKAGVKKRILFLADRNILISQTKNNDFKYFGDKMTWIKNRTVDKSYEIYLALYQGISGSEDFQNIYRQFSPSFFDLIVVDECHRGSAAEDSAWRDILSYFSSATQIGLTATPKETKDVSNIDYFGEPVYTYSLKQGIEDGFLAPYKVIRVMMDRDEEGWRPTLGQKDEYGQEIPDEVYTGRDFDKKIILDERTKLVAKKITEYLKNTDRFAKTIVFCEDIEHAERMRVALVNENADLVAKNYKYVMRITGDNDEGKRELDSFIDPASLYPAIVTTSKLLTTGVDVQTCKLVVLDSNIKSMTEFKQIIGRGTRIREDYGKTFFTIIDFRKVTNLFADPHFDGDPVQIYTPKPEDPINPPQDTTSTDDTSNTGDEGKVIYDPPDAINQTGAGFVNDKPRKYMVRGVPVTVIHERVQLIDTNGKLITESLKDYSRASALREYQSLDNFLTLWNSTERKQVLIEEMLSKGIFLQELEREIGKKLDPFDLICYIAFDKPYLTRKQRAEMVKKGNYFDKYGEKAKEVIFELLDKYADQGIEAVEEISVLGVKPFPEYGTPSEIINDYFGGRDQYLSALADMEKYLYTSHQTL